MNAPALETLSEDTMAGDPMTQFAGWMDQAERHGLAEPTAMVLATASAEGRPRARTVLLKAHGAEGFTFYTNRTSRKGQDLAARPRACAVFPWYALGRQVTAEGPVRMLSQADSEPYYRSRPRGSQLGAWASRQSRVIASRAELERRVAELEQRWPEPQQVPMPDFWGGYVLVPDTVEFWQSGRYRLHDRLRYYRDGDGWAIERLSPLVSARQSSLRHSITSRRTEKLTAHGLIDTTEMYLRTIFELEEEGVTPLRARIAERLGQTGPTVSQTVARMERDGLVHVQGDRQLSLSDEGRTLATRVMRKHRLAECLLVGVIKLPWEEVHIEACRWEHVISESVERRVVELLGYPVRCPHGNLIPGLAELGLPDQAAEKVRAAVHEAGEAMTKVASPDSAPAVIRRIGEQIQSDLDLMLKLKHVGIQPGREVKLMASHDGVCVTAGDSTDAISTQLPGSIAAHIFVSVPGRPHSAVP